MARSVFNDTFDTNNDVKVNSFDWSHANNLSTDTGRITPCFCELVPAKGSLRINPRFGLQFMPMNFPVQTRMKARISFYKYPLRALWKDYRDFVGNFREGLEEPYIDFNTELKVSKMADTCTLGDYLGLPTTLVGKFGSNVTTGSLYAGAEDNGEVSIGYRYSSPVTVSFTKAGIMDMSQAAFNQTFQVPNFTVTEALNYYTKKTWNVVGSVLYGDSNVKLTSNSSISLSFVVFNKVPFDPSNMVAYVNFVNSEFKNAGILYSDKFEVEQITDGYKVTVEFFLGDIAADVEVYDFGLCIPSSEVDDRFRTGNLLTGSVWKDFTFTISSPAPVGMNLGICPYYGSGQDSNKIKISAYAFRAYEGIYNAYFRDNRNNPYYVNGRVEYNKWIPTDEGGADNNVYELHRANWEQDFLTTAVFSPQQGDPSRPPLVGITTYTDTVSNDDGTVTTKEKVAVVDEDGKKFGVEFSSDEDGLTDVSYTELADGQPVKNSRSLFDLATSGIAIETLRNVNAYQKFLELNMRKGYSYRDIIQGRFNVKVRYDELLMPEFLGGFSRDVDVNAVTQSVDQSIGKADTTYSEALGSQAGLAGVRGGSDNSISVFCDEECIIMGLITVTPLPVYSQLLPKHFLYRGLLDHYQPEFNHLGFQPILYKEVCPVQAYNDNPESLSETFGYQRPWYEYVQKYDTAHGLMRTQLRNFLMNRTFDEKPTLSQSFLLVDPKQINDVFAVTETTDKIFGQIWFDCTAKLPIARVAIPRLD